MVSRKPFTMLLTSTRAKLFAIRCRINQAVQISDISHIMVITDTIHLVRYIFDLTTHPYPIQLIAIVQDLRVFFNKHANILIDFWNCSNNTKCSYYISVDKNTKKFNLTPILLYKELWDFSKKEECDNIIRNWQIIF